MLVSALFKLCKGEIISVLHCFCYLLTNIYTDTDRPTTSSIGSIGATLDLHLKITFINFVYGSLTSARENVGLISNYTGSGVPSVR